MFEKILSTHNYSPVAVGQNHLTAMKFASLLAFLCSSVTAFAALPKMYCDSVCGTENYCGVLTLERGEASGNYRHDTPVLHGLWPETGKYGDSLCVRSRDSFDPSEIACYTDEEFAKHEWYSHGYCAEKTAAEYFHDACEMARAPLKLMTEARRRGKDLTQMADELENAGYAVWSLNEKYDELSISVCSGGDLDWTFAEVSDATSPQHVYEASLLQDDEGNNGFFAFGALIFFVSMGGLAYYFLKIRSASYSIFFGHIFLILLLFFRSENHHSARGCTLRLGPKTPR